MTRVVYDDVCRFSQQKSFFQSFFSVPVKSLFSNYKPNARMIPTKDVDDGDDDDLSFNLDYFFFSFAGQSSARVPCKTSIQSNGNA